MNTIDPEKIPELVALNNILNDKGFAITVSEAPEIQATYALEYSYDWDGANSVLGKKLEAAAEKLVPASGGEIRGFSKSGGFLAVFHNQDERLYFLKVFSATAVREVPDFSAPGKIHTTQKGFKLGAEALRPSFLE